ncbi:hypothetical protein Pmani_004933 [Petrolisthes manimaculis]|uniref:Uncharacterized protein n=1 Tax=Petrolisthes manimaculis TaxID=1843537 RepID=A0AAE1QD50_9EUCA|nr:hypothetical protein Pmani_004933 [Petrolisthes manimaculis]
MSDKSAIGPNDVSLVVREEGRFLTGGGGGGSNFTVEGIAFILLLTFMARVVGDIINRVRLGRSLLEWPPWNLHGLERSPLESPVY